MTFADGHGLRPRWQAGGVLVAGVFLALLSACGTRPVAHTPTERPLAPSSRDVSASDPSMARLMIAAVGDIMLGTDFPQDLLPPPETALLEPFSAILSEADVALGNLEGVLMDGGEPTKACQSQAHCYRFRTPTRFAGQLKAAGFDVLSLANNHARDFGEHGRQNTMAALDRVGIAHSGPIGSVASWSQRGWRLAFIAFAPFRGANNPLDIERARARVAALAAEHDVVLVSMHMGGEGEEYLHVPFGPEFFHGEARGDVVAFARAMVEAGADAVIGHGPHVPRALELYRERLIAYSLGNFCTYWGINVKGPNGLAPLLEFEVDRQGRFLNGRIVSARQLRPRGPLPDPSDEAAQLIGELTRNDFPDTALHITPKGRLLRTQPLSPSPAETASAADKAAIQR